MMVNPNPLIKRILVVCVGNICRSPMASELLRERFRLNGYDINVSSAGLGTVDGQAADPIAIDLLDERGLDLRNHQSQEFSPGAALDFDLILVMSTEMRRSIESRWPLLQGRVYRLGHWGNFDIDDPHRRGEAAFRTALKSIETGVTAWLNKIGG